MCPVKKSRSSVILMFVMVTIASGMDINLDKEWKLYKDYFSKNYTSKDEAKRRPIWEDNILNVVRHNIAADQELYSYRSGINVYSDMDIKEFQSNVTGLLPHNVTHEARKKMLCHPMPDNRMNETVDWRDLGHVGRVKNQGQCGSCWAFCTAGALEALHMRKTGKFVYLSEQNLVDCSKGGNKGCAGGYPSTAIEYVMKNEGIDTEESYPYEARDRPCRFNRSSIGATCSYYAQIAGFDEKRMKVIVGSVGPIAVGMNAGNPEFQQYRNGVFFGSGCDKKHLDHCVLIIGYGKENGMDYWLVKNSWGESWGDGGHFKIARNVNECGISTKPPVYPVS